MRVYQYISLVSLAIWIIIPFFRYKKRNFLFFLFLAANDLFGRILFYGFSLATDTMWIPIHYLLLFSLDEKFFDKYKIPILLGFFPFVALGYFATNEERRIFITVIHCLILLWFTKDLIKEIIVDSKLDLFLMVIVFYESVMVFKLIAMLHGIRLGIEVFFSGTAIQILVGLFLIFVRRDIKFSFKDDTPPKF